MFLLAFKRLFKGKSLIVFSLCLGLAIPARAELRLPRLFSDNMVLQQGIRAPVWGWADPGELIVVDLEGQSAAATTGQDGRWSVRIGPLEAGGPFSLKISASSDTIRISNVLVGEVWLCSGQSNMALTLGDIKAAQTIAEAAAYPMIRQFQTKYATAAEPLEDVESSPQTAWLSTWEAGSSSSAQHFTAVGYYFALYLQQQLGVPIGLINNSVGGTVAEAWSGSSVFEDIRLAPILTEWPLYTQEYDWIRDTYADHLKAVEQARQQGLPEPLYFCQPSVLYNAMTAPLMPYGIRGATWYQGESNIYRAEQYRILFPALIRNWREGWSQGDFPFLFVQLTSYESGTGKWPELREAQKQGLALPNTGMAVTIDVGEADNIHPRNKKEVGRRLSLIARALVYGDSLLYSGPVCSSAVVQGNRCYLSFTQVGNGLVSRDSGPLAGFTAAGSDSLFYPASAVIEGDRVVVWSDEVTEPVSVRYAWADNPVGANLFNMDGDSLGLPALPFEWWREKGDLDGDGKVGIYDLLELLKVLGGAAARTALADLDANGKVDIFDLLTLLELL
ncbi:MAG: hypothetical protein A3F83_07980 [Candidatus Glassbacteria bacterium RIFCSPLOWO2_12_FULL_58_11]|uniref:EF-hand domain-containing protein n=1 Tax=Candidatus Glassbacteria bacterium RIFCSPLOWO2_12_FULL_58_11 TaxID=1817867 RepID=A0A1F5YQ36_9BACT|nr:MAG: hypothetical protein A3F83_07980 [Candidatus Glassbacteria bacterium RIFCSPLOWO2_12_FULL_58_11]